MPDSNKQTDDRGGRNGAASRSGDEPPIVFQLNDVAKSWPGDNGFELTVPKLAIRQGEKVALVGFSGCGKSTLLDLLAMVLRPDSSKEFTFLASPKDRLNVADAWRKKNKNALARARLRFIGYVLQTGGLLPFLSVGENIGLSLNGLGRPDQEAVTKLATRLGIERHLRKYPGQLSVGERQRVAIARALAHEPAVVIADEPTASLDPINAEEIMGIFTEVASEKGVTFIVATHEWKRVEELGFRQVKFNLARSSADGTVRAEVVD